MPTNHWSSKCNQKILQFGARTKPLLWLFHVQWVQLSTSFPGFLAKNWNWRQVFQDIWQKIGASIPCFVTFLPLPIKAIPFHSQRCRKTAGPTVRFAPLDPTFPFPPFLPLSSWGLFPLPVASEYQLNVIFLHFSSPTNRGTDTTPLAARTPTRATLTITAIATARITTRTTTDQLTTVLQAAKGRTPPLRRTECCCFFPAIRGVRQNLGLTFTQS